MEFIEFIDLGLRDYKETWDLQQQVLEKLVRAKTGSPDPGCLALPVFRGTSACLYPG